MLWLQFLICALLIFVAGSRLSTYAGIISDRTGFSASIMGIIVLAFITSCPELVTSLTSITKAVDAPDMAIGDLLGANMYNILVIALLGILCGKGSLLRGLNRVNRLTAALTIAMFGIILGTLLLYNIGGLPLGIFRISYGSMLLALVYIAGAIIIYKHGISNDSRSKEGKIPSTLMAKFISSAIVIILAGVWLAHIGKAIAGRYNLGEMYVGVLLIALATTLPEWVVSFTALKRNSVSMAAGNLLGSNLFNLFIIAILDIALRKGEFFAHVSKLNILPALAGTMLTITALVAMTKSPSRVKRHVSWDFVIIIVLFSVGHILLFNLAK